MNRQEFVRAMDEALQAFLRDTEAFREAVISATRLGWGGSQGYVELFPDGSYRSIRGTDLGDLYESPGLVLRVPPLPDEEMQAYQADPAYDLGVTLRELGGQLWASYEEVLEELEELS